MKWEYCTPLPPTPTLPNPNSNTPLPTTWLGYLLQKLQGGILIPGQALRLLHSLSPDLPSLTVQDCQPLLEEMGMVSQALGRQG